MENGTISGIAHIAYLAHDMDRMMEFYCGVLGFRKKFLLPDENGRPWIQYVEVAPRQYIEFFYDYKDLTPENSFARMARLDRLGPMHLSLEVKNIRALAEHLRAHDVRIVTDVTLGDDGTWQIWFEDPEGNPIEFHEYTDESLQLTT